jgi:hypothetical protein
MIVDGIIDSYIGLESGSKKKNIIIMDDNYIGNGSNNANGFQIDRYFLDTCNAYINSHSK